MSDNFMADKVSTPLNLLSSIVILFSRHIHSSKPAGDLSRAKSDFMQRAVLVRTELSKSGKDKEITTSWSQQAYFIHWMKCFGLADPCGNYYCEGIALEVYT